MRQSAEYYNEELKTRFILDKMCEKDSNGDPAKDSAGEYIILAKSKNRYNKVRSIFHKLAAFEQKYEKDFYEIESDKDEEFINDLFSRWISELNENYSIFVLSIFKQYIMWCRDEGLLSTQRYYQHPFFDMEMSGWKKKDTSSTFRSERVKNQLEAIANKSTDELAENYVFPSEDDFFTYVVSVFSEEGAIMTGAIMCLLYYGFQSEEIRVIKRKDVDVDTRTVCGKYIDHDIAWSIICKAKNTTTYLPNHAKGQLGKLEMNLGDGPYLIRTSRESSNDNPVPIGYFKDLYRREKKIVEGLPPTSNYKNILVKTSTIKNLREFYEIMSEEHEYGIEYVAEKFRQNQYDTPLTFRKYQIMREKARKL